MMASDFVPTFLSPVEYGIVGLHRLLMDFRVQSISQTTRGALIIMITLCAGAAITWSGTAMYTTTAVLKDLRQHRCLQANTEPSVAE